MTTLLVLCCFSFLLAGVFGADVTVSAIKGDPVTLPINPDEIKGGEELFWMFENTNIATIDLEVKTREAKYPDKRFKDRLNLDLNGFLTINNIRTDDRGEYKLEIRSSGKPKYKTFSVSVNDEVESISWKVGTSLTLNINTETQADDVIEWKFENTLIAKLNRTAHPHPDHVLDGRFRGRLDVNLFGSLIFTHIKTEDSGLYDVSITNREHIIHKRFRVTVTGVSGDDVTVSAMKGSPVTLPIKTDEIKGAEKLFWKFNNTNIATIDLEVKTSEAKYPDEEIQKFSGRLNLDRTTGSLTINNIRTDDKGEYKLEIKSGVKSKYKTFSVTVNDKVEPISEMVGETLSLDTTTQTPADVIEWKFENTPIAKIDRTAPTRSDLVLDKRFRGRLHVDVFGSLIIKKLKNEDSGLYDVKIINSNHTIHKRFRVTVTESTSRSHQVKIGPGLFVVVIMLMIALVMPVTGDD